MPLVRVDIPQGTSDDKKRELWQGLKGAIDKALSPGGKSADPNVMKFEYVAISEAFGEVGNGLPTVSVDLRPGAASPIARRRSPRASARCSRG